MVEVRVRVMVRVRVRVSVSVNVSVRSVSAYEAHVPGLAERASHCMW